jgi:hypothetical protein
MLPVLIQNFHIFIQNPWTGGVDIQTNKTRFLTQKKHNTDHATTIFHIRMTPTKYHATFKGKTIMQWTNEINVYRNMEELKINYAWMVDRKKKRWDRKIFASIFLKPLRTQRPAHTWE